MVESVITENTEDKKNLSSIALRAYSDQKDSINQGVDNEIQTYLIRRYEEKGRNFFFRAAQLPFSLLSAQRKGAAVRRICEATQLVEKWNTGRIMVWRTKFTTIAVDYGMSHGLNMKE